MGGSDELYNDKNLDWTFCEITAKNKQLLDQDKQNYNKKSNSKQPWSKMENIKFHNLRGTSTSIDMENYEALNLASKTCEDWDFDMFSLNHATDGHAIEAISHEIFSRHNLLEKYDLKVAHFMCFIKEVENNYRKNAYHNAIHAADVMQTANCILINTGFVKLVTDVELFCMLITGLCHDIDHTGTNNAFHTNAGTEYAKLYVVSIQENHHLRLTLRLLREFDILRNMTPTEQSDFKRLMSWMILATDMSNHFLLLTNMDFLLQSPSKSVDRLRFMRVLMLIFHAADISNPAKPWQTHKVWVTLLIDEFFKQGDLEKKWGLPVTQNCDRDSANIASLQIGFMKTFTEPTFDVMDKIMQKDLTAYGFTCPIFNPWVQCMKETQTQWNGRWRYLKYEQFDSLLQDTAPRMSILLSLGSSSNLSDYLVDPRGRKRHNRLCGCSCCRRLKR